MQKAIQDAFVAAAIKQRKALAEGGWGHAIWCNFQIASGSGHGKCNCGVADLQKALELHEQATASGEQVFKEECPQCERVLFNTDLKDLKLISFDGLYSYATRYCANSSFCCQKAHEEAEAAMNAYANSKQ